MLIPPAWWPTRLVATAATVAIVMTPAMAGQRQFLAPWKAGATKDYSSNQHLTIGEQVQMSWNLAVSGANMTLAQDNFAGDAQGGPTITIQKGVSGTTWTWVVTYGGLDPTYHNVYYLIIDDGDGDEATTHYFYIADAPVAGTPSSTTVAPSVVVSTVTASPSSSSTISAVVQTTTIQTATSVPSTKSSSVFSPLPSSTSTSILDTSTSAAVSPTSFTATDSILSATSSSKASSAISQTSSSSSTTPPVGTQSGAATDNTNNVTSSLSAGAAAGIAIGALVLLLALIMVIWLLWRRRRRRPQERTSAGTLGTISKEDSSGHSYPKTGPHPVHEAMGHDPRPEMQGTYPVWEMDARSRPVEMGHHGGYR